MSICPQEHTLFSACSVITGSVQSLSGAVVPHGDASVQSGQWWKQGPEACSHKGEVVTGVWHDQKSLCLWMVLPVLPTEMCFWSLLQRKGIWDWKSSLFVVLLRWFFFFFNPSPLVLSWRSYDEARSILEQRRMKWKGLLNLHLSWLSFNVFSSGLQSFNWSAAVVQDNGLPWPCYSSQLTWQWRKRPIIAISIKTSWLKAWEGQQGSGTNT